MHSWRVLILNSDLIWINQKNFKRILILLNHNELITSINLFFLLKFLDPDIESETFSIEILQHELENYTRVINDEKMNVQYKSYKLQ